MKKIFSPTPAHVYLHWPFCKSKCYYCDFVAFEKHEGFELSYHQGLTKEIEDFLTLHREEPQQPISSIYFGGGTPSLYPIKLITETFDFLNHSFFFQPDAEITLEVNPGGVTHTALRTWQKCGINRLSIGIQILDDEILKKLNRHQKTSEVYRLMAMAPRYFSNISVDLMVGLPEVDQATWHKTLHTVVAWPITHISMYVLMVHEQTPLYFQTKNNKLQLPPDTTTITQYNETVDFLASYGFEQYEISNFARPGFQSKHNKAYWERKPYVGFGLGAASFNGSQRFTNEKNLQHYLDYWHKGIKPPHSRSSAQSETLSPKQIIIETAMLGLRQAEGLHLPSFKKMLDKESLTKLDTSIELLTQQGFIHYTRESLVLTRKGMSVENAVVLALI